MTSDNADDLSVPLTPGQENTRNATRCAFFLQLFEVYQSKLVQSGVLDAEMNRTLLGNAVESYFLDIQRLKSFHGLQRANRYKRAGFTIKWLCRIRPIQVRGIDGLDRRAQRRALLVNADFALIAALNLCRIDHERIDKSLVEGLLYTAHYRDAEGNVMAQMLQAVDLAAEAREKAEKWRSMAQKLHARIWPDTAEMPSEGPGA